MPLVKSSHLRSIKHNNSSRELNIRFSNGSEYVYEDVNKKEYNNLFSAFSKGKFFWQNIREEKTTIKTKEGTKGNRRKKK